MKRKNSERIDIKQNPVFYYNYLFGGFVEITDAKFYVGGCYLQLTPAP